MLCSMYVVQVHTMCYQQQSYISQVLCTFFGFGADLATWVFFIFFMGKTNTKLGYYTFRGKNRQRNPLSIPVYRIVARSRPGYYSIFDPFVQRSQYILSIKFPLHKQSENP